jgi:lipopolysaccharide heptosyltransferase I
MAAAERIALVKLSSLGDVVHALPVAATLKAARPNARLAWIVERREAAVLRDHPALDELIVVDTRRWRKARTPGDLVAAGRDILAVRRTLRARHFDVALDLQGLIKSGVLAASTGAPLRVGFGRPWRREPARRLFTNREVAPPVARHVVEQYLALLAPLGITTPRLEFQLPTVAAAETRVDDWLTAAGLKARQRLVVLNPGAGRADKRWPVARFAELAARLGHDAGAHVVVTWGPGEERAARAIVEGAGAAGPRALLAPATDLDELISLLRRASVLVAADTGPLHLAAALGTPCVGVYGPTTAARNGPYGAGHATLAAPGGVMESLSTAPVLAAVMERLG